MPRTWTALLVSVLCALSLCSLALAQERPALHGVPEWILSEKIRATYTSQWSSEELPAAIAAADFNTMLIAFVHQAGHFEKWANLTREHDLRFFATLWVDYLSYAEAIHGPGGAGSPPLSAYRSFVHRTNGPSEVVLCPVDKDYWERWLVPSALEMAELSLEHGALDGIIIDAELYGPLTTRPAIPVSFYMDMGPCLCDDCFGDFVHHTGADPSAAQLPWDQRYDWLVTQDLTLPYNLRLRDRVAALATDLRERVHALNPDLLLGFLNWYRNEVVAGPSANYFLHGWFEGFRTAERPVMVWTESPEYEAGYGPHTDARADFFRSVGDVIYVPGLYLERHAPDLMPRQMQDLAAAAHGYWIFTREAEFFLCPPIHQRLQRGNELIISQAPTAAQLPFLDLWADYDPLLNLNAGWRFRPDPDDVGREQGWCGPPADLADWEPIEVGKFWDEHLGTQYFGAAWYRVDIEVPAQAAGRELSLVFGAVDEEAWVWVNGQFAGEHTEGPDGWRDRFVIPVTDQLIPGETNSIAVRVYNSTMAGGIWLPVHLIAGK